MATPQQQETVQDTAKLQKQLKKRQRQYEEAATKVARLRIRLFRAEEKCTKRMQQLAHAQKNSLQAVESTPILSSGTRKNAVSKTETQKEQLGTSLPSRRRVGVRRQSPQSE